MAQGADLGAGESSGVQPGDLLEQLRAVVAAHPQHVDEIRVYLDGKRDLAGEIRRIEQAPTAREALREMAALQARMNPGVWAVARAVDAVRRTDRAAERSWQDRLQHRLVSAGAKIPI